MYLWYKQENGANAVVDIRVLYDNEEAPAGYKKVARNMGKGSPREVYVCFKTEEVLDEYPEDGSVSLPICEIVIMYNDSNPGEGWEKIDRTFNGADNAAFMWVKRGTGRFEAKVCSHGQLHHIGNFDTALEAAEAPVVRGGARMEGVYSNEDGSLLLAMEHIKGLADPNAKTRKQARAVLLGQTLLTTKGIIDEGDHNLAARKARHGLRGLKMLDVLKHGFHKTLGVWPGIKEAMNKWKNE